MNCKFCGTLMPDTEDATATCPICGRRQDERPIGELLSENMSGSSAAEEQRDDIKKTSEPKEKKSLLTPLAAIAVAVAGWLYGISQNIFGTIQTIFNGTYGQGAALASDSDFQAGSASVGADLSALGLVGIVVILVTIIGIVGLVLLVKRLIGNLKK